MTSKEKTEVRQIGDHLLYELGLTSSSSIIDELGGNEDTRASSAAELVNSREGMREVF